MSDALKLVPIEVKLREKEKSQVKTKELLEFVQRMLPNPLFYPIVVYEDETETNVIAYLVMIVVNDKLMDMQAINVIRAWYEPHHKEMKETIWSIIQYISKEYNIHKVRLSAKRGQRALNKTWGFIPTATIMERRV
jgi:hypothetical protein